MSETIPYEIEFGNKKYILEANKFGNPKIKRYDEKFKMWVTLNFPREENGCRKELIAALSKEFIQKSAGI